MLVLSRRVGERIIIGDDVVVTIVQAKGDRITLGIDAPRSVPVLRHELVEAVIDENRAARQAPGGVAPDALRTLRRALGQRAAEHVVADADKGATGD